MLDLIIDPERYFSELRRDADLNKPALIVAFLAIVVSYYQYRLMLKLSAVFPGDIAR